MRGAVVSLIVLTNCNTLRHVRLMSRSADEWDANVEERKKNVIRRRNGAVDRAEDRPDARETGADGS